mmetsp:Transcript_18977/g.37258  ORF Transcript_18977/g.37258 Transcript_18977/m.37258 type:complete len:410 (+) Transcript_18977:239-1468(+)
MTQGLPRTPPPVPPRRRRADGGSPSALTAEDINRVSSVKALSPLSVAQVNFDEGDDEEEKVDEEYRTVLLNRLQQYFLVYEPDRVGQGIGHIVDWALVHGEKELNERLLVKYGESLVEFERRYLVEASAIQDRGRPDHAESFMGPPTVKSLPFQEDDDYPSAYESSSNTAGEQAARMIRHRLQAFYTKYDPERRRKGLEDLVSYVSHKGLDALNRKLVKKYGVTLEDFEQGIERMRERETQTANDTVADREQEGVGNSGKRISIRSMLRRSFRASFVTARPDHLPPYVPQLLELFYSKYDQSKISSGGVEAIYRWTKKHGLEALNRQLKKKYLEDLTEFTERMGALRDDLEDFYSVHDSSKLASGGIDAILRWGIRNGRKAINHQLQKKYNSDLDHPEGVVARDDDNSF